MIKEPGVIRVLDSKKPKRTVAREVLLSALRLDPIPSIISAKVSRVVGYKCRKLAGPLYYVLARNAKHHTSYPIWKYVVFCYDLKQPPYFIRELSRSSTSYTSLLLYSQKLYYWYKELEDRDLQDILEIMATREKAHRVALKHRAELEKKIWNQYQMGQYNDK